MSENKKFIPKRRFKEFQNADTWEQRELIKVANYRNGKAHEQDISDDGPYVVVNSKFISTDGTVRKFASKQSEPLSKDEIAFVLSDVPNGRAIARTYLVPESGKYTLNQRIAGITPNSETFAYFLYILMNRNKYFLAFDTGVGQTNLSRTQVEQFEGFYPSFEEQVKIGDFFYKLDQTIAFQQRKLEKMKAMKSAYLSEMFPAEGERKPKRRFPGFTDDWEQCELGEVGNTFTGLSGKTKEDFGHGEGKFITYMNVFSNPVADLDGTESVEIDNKQFQVKSGDVLFTTSSETPEEVGMSSVWLGNADNIYLNSFCFGYRPTIEFDKYYLAFMLRSTPIRKKFQLLAQGISRYNISKNKVMEMSAPVPSIREQKALGAFFKNLDQTIAFQQQKLEKLQNIKKAYLNEMFI